jgi:UDP-glucose 4-epimerase
MMNILVTGGAGYIGSHTVVELLSQDYKVVVVDNLSNSSRMSIERIEKITGKKPVFFNIDIAKENQLDNIFKKNDINAVIHFAGLKSVGESIHKALYYYQNNLDSTLRLLETMKKFSVKKMVFSSSATVYGYPEELPLKENSRVGVGITNPYGQTKFMIEQILSDIAKSNEDWSFTSLRYFNPIGAHTSGLIGEDPNDIPNNLLPYISQVAIGKLKLLKVFGNDYDTPDGTGVRDYVHVVDLAQAHLLALQHMSHENEHKIYNIGTGKGTSVLELVEAFKKASLRRIPITIVDRRPGDIATCFADSTLAFTELGWKAKLTIEDGCKDSWNWQSKNPNGYDQ